MRVLIIGSLGVLGQELIRVFLEDASYETVGWDINEIDIANRQQVWEKINVLKPDIIINAAAYNAVDKVEEPKEFEMAREVNGWAPGYLARQAKSAGVVFVHFSTDYVFPGERREGYKENDWVSPISNYGISKALGEDMVRHIGGRYYIIRLQKLFGRTGDSPAAKKSFFEMMLDLARTKKELDVVDDELANFTYAPDLAGQVKYLIENPSTSSGYNKKNNISVNLFPERAERVERFPYGIYHITNEGRPVTWFGAARILFDLAGVKDIRLNPVDSDKFPRPAKRPKYSVLLNTKLPALRPWDEALKEFLKNIK